MIWLKHDRLVISDITHEVLICLLLARIDAPIFH